MLRKKLAVLVGSALALATASTAFAQHRDYRDGYRARHYQERAYVRPYYAPRYVPRTVYYTPAPVYYAPAPAYYYPEPAYYAPAPVYYGGGATVGGALVGAIIGNQVSDRRHRGAATLGGAIIGATIGSSIDRGY